MWRQQKQMNWTREERRQQQPQIDRIELAKRHVANYLREISNNATAPTPTYFYGQQQQCYQVQNSQSEYGTSGFLQYHYQLGSLSKPQEQSMNGHQLNRASWEEPPDLNGKESFDAVMDFFQQYDQSTVGWTDLERIDALAFKLNCRAGRAFDRATELYTDYQSIRTYVLNYMYETDPRIPQEQMRVPPHPKLSASSVVVRSAPRPAQVYIEPEKQSRRMVSDCQSQILSSSNIQPDVRVSSARMAYSSAFRTGQTRSQVPENFEKKSMRVSDKFFIPMEHSVPEKCNKIQPKFVEQPARDYRKFEPKMMPCRETSNFVMTKVSISFSTEQEKPIVKICSNPFGVVKTSESNIGKIVEKPKENGMKKEEDESMKPSEKPMVTLNEIKANEIELTPIEFEREKEQENDLEEDRDEKLPIDDDEALRVTEMTCEHQLHEKSSFENKSLENDKIEEEICEMNKKDEGYGESEIEEELCEEENALYNEKKLMQVKSLEEKIVEKVLDVEKQQRKEKQEEKESTEGKVKPRDPIEICGTKVKKKVGKSGKGNVTSRLIQSSGVIANLEGGDVAVGRKQVRMYRKCLENRKHLDNELNVIGIGTAGLCTKISNYVSENSKCWIEKEMKIGRRSKKGDSDRAGHVRLEDGQLFLSAIVVTKRKWRKRKRHMGNNGFGKCGKYEEWPKANVHWEDFGLWRFERHKIADNRADESKANPFGHPKPFGKVEWRRSLAFLARDAFFRWWWDVLIVFLRRCLVN